MQEVPTKSHWSKIFEASKAYTIKNLQICKLRPWLSAGLFLKSIILKYDFSFKKQGCLPMGRYYHYVAILVPVDKLGCFSNFGEKFGLNKKWSSFLCGTSAAT